MEKTSICNIDNLIFFESQNLTLYACTATLFVNQLILICSGTLLVDVVILFYYHICSEMLSINQLIYNLNITSYYVLENCFGSTNLYL